MISPTSIDDSRESDNHVIDLGRVRKNRPVARRKMHFLLDNEF